MNTSQDGILHLIKKLEELIPSYMKKEEENNISNGNVAVCIIDEAGGVYGKVFVNNDKIRARESFRVAWIKASQVWLTGMKTGEYEKKIYNNEIAEEIAGISKRQISWSAINALDRKSSDPACRVKILNERNYYF